VHLYTQTGGSRSSVTEFVFILVISSLWDSVDRVALEKSEVKCWGQEITTDEHERRFSWRAVRHVGSHSCTAFCFKYHCCIVELLDDMLKFSYLFVQLICGCIQTWIMIDLRKITSYLKLLRTFCCISKRASLTRICMRSRMHMKMGKIFLCKFEFSLLSLFFSYVCTRRAATKPVLILPTTSLVFFKTKSMRFEHPLPLRHCTMTCLNRQRHL